MLKTVIKLPDGTKLSSGGSEVNAIRSVTLTECVNSGEELTLGSTCANAFEATLFTPDGNFVIAAGTEVEVYKENPTGVSEQVGIFILEKPTRPSANTMKLTGYDKVSKLDKDLTAWLSGLAGWPYTLTTFAGMVCEACGLDFQPTEVPNGGFQVQQFARSSVTGRQIMRWLGEICARFCRATADGKIEFAWYKDSGKTITSTGDPYYFQNGLTYEDFSTAPIDAVQIRLADSEDGALFPEAGENVNNSYIITGNPILNAQIGKAVKVALGGIKAELAAVSYTPCKVEIPANMDIHAGHMIKVTDKNGKTVMAYVMTKTQTGQKDVLECTGSHRRDTSSVMNNQSSSSSVESAAQNIFAGMTSAQLRDKLTDGGKIKGIFVRDNVWVINADEAIIDNLIAAVVASKQGNTTLKISGATLFLESSDDFNNYGEALLMVEEQGTPSLRLVRVWPDNRGFMARLADNQLWFVNDPEVDGYQAEAVIGVNGYKIEGQERGYLRVDMINDMMLSWKDNGDGTFSLIGRDVSNYPFS